MSLDYARFDSARSFVIVGSSNEFSVSYAGSTKGGGYWVTTVTRTATGTTELTLNNTGSGAYSAYFVPYTDVAEPIVGQGLPYDALGYDFSFNVQRLYEDLGLTWQSSGDSGRVVESAASPSDRYAFDLGATARPALLGHAALTPGSDQSRVYLQTGDGALWANGRFLEAARNPDSGFRLQEVTDFDGNRFPEVGSWALQGHADVNRDGRAELVLTNSALGRWMTLGFAADGSVDTSNLGRNATRVVGVYEEPIIENRGTAFDSARRLEDDLRHDRLEMIGGGDSDGDGIDEVWFVQRGDTATTGDDVYLRALMHDDGNIRYANYMSLEQMQSYATLYGSVAQGNWMVFSATA